MEHIGSIAIRLPCRADEEGARSDGASLVVDLAVACDGQEVGPHQLPRRVSGTGRDPEDRLTRVGDTASIREKMMDKTLADSYPASDPPSTLPNPSTDSLC